MQCDNNVMSKTSPDSSSLVSTRQQLSAQCNLELFFPKENNQNVFSLDDSEHISSVVDTLPKGEIFLKIYFKPNNDIHEIVFLRAIVYKQLIR